MQPKGRTKWVEFNRESWLSHEKPGFGEKYGRGGLGEGLDYNKLTGVIFDELPRERTKGSREKSR